VICFPFTYVRLPFEVRGSSRVVGEERGRRKIRPVFEWGNFHSTVSVLKNAVLAHDI